MILGSSRRISQFCVVLKLEQIIAIIDHIAPVALVAQE
jgi:hypothetical protein